jgi:hypothetical protein
MHSQVMFTVRDWQLAEMQGLRLTWAGTYASGLPVRQPVADAVDVAVHCVRFDMMPEHRAAGLSTNGQQVAMNWSKGRAAMRRLCLVLHSRSEA